MSLRRRPSAQPVENVLLKKLGYSIGKTIGKGTYSKVCLATNARGEMFACKIIKKKVDFTDFIEKFLPRELEIIATLKHPNIVQVHKVLESNDAIFMIMDYCRHGDLLEYVKYFGCFPEAKAKHYFMQIVEAVNYLHELDIAHRDLKCENIFLMANNRVKLGDFGFARTCTDQFGRKVFSDTFCGSAAYAAPEILKGISYDPKMYDMWALGCVLYIMVTASMPFDDSNMKRMIRAQMNRSLFSVTVFWTKCSNHLKKLVNSLLEPQLEKRLTIKAVKQHPWFKDLDLSKANKKFLSVSDPALL